MADSQEGRQNMMRKTYSSSFSLQFVVWAKLYIKAGRSRYKKLPFSFLIFTLYAT